MNCIACGREGHSSSSCPRQLWRWAAPARIGATAPPARGGVPAPSAMPKAGLLAASCDRVREAWPSPG